MANDVRDYGRPAIEQNFASEFALRDIKLPYDLVRADFERYIAETDLAIEELKNHDPAQYENMSRGINNDLQAFRSARDKSRN